MNETKLKIECSCGASIEGNPRDIRDELGIFQQVHAKCVKNTKPPITAGEETAKEETSEQQARDMLKSMNIAGAENFPVERFKELTKLIRQRINLAESVSNLSGVLFQKYGELPSHTGCLPTKDK